MAATTPLPTLVFSSELEHRKKWNFLNVVDKTNRLKRLPGLDEGRTLLYMYNPDDGGWLLLEDGDSQEMFLFNLTSFQRIPVPPPDDRTCKFAFSLTYPPSHPDSSLVAVHVRDGYWLQCRPGGDADVFTEHAFEDEDEQSRQVTAKWYKRKAIITTYQGKVVVDTGSNIHMIDPVSETVDSFKTGYRKNALHRLISVEISSMLIKVDGDIFKVNWNFYSQTYSSVLQSMDVLKLDLPNREWVPVNDIGDRVFFMGKPFSVACSSSTSIKGNRIYFVDDNDEQRLCYYDLDYGKLTTYLPCPGNNGRSVNPPCWVILNKAIEEKLAGSLDQDEYELSSDSDENGLQIITKEKMVMDSTNNVAQAPPEKAICLLFTHKNDGNYMLVEPFTKAHKSLHLPQITPGSVLYSTPVEGWLVVRQSMEAVFLFNLLTSELIQLPDLEETGFLYQLALSSPPTSPDCMLFGVVAQEDEQITEIIFHRLGDPEWTKRSYCNERENPFYPVHNNPVFYKGKFHCLGCGGELGVYDHNKKKWSVVNIMFDELYRLLSIFQQCFLLEWEGNLWAVLVDENDYPLEVVQLKDEWEKATDIGDAMDGWEKVTDFGDRVLYLGRYASFLRPSPDEKSKNSICLQRFDEEDEYLGTVISPWEHDYNEETVCYENTEYTLNPCWIEVPMNIFDTQDFETHK